MSKFRQYYESALLRELEKNGQIRNYDWGGMAYATLMHFMTQLSRRSLSSLGGAPFVWQVSLEFFARCRFWKIILVMYGFWNIILAMW